MSKPLSDQHFDGIAEKFNRNIYGTTKGQLRHLMLLEAMRACLQTKQRVFEIGGGTGQMAAALAQAGHQVMMTEPSADMLALAQQSFAEQQLAIETAQLNWQDIPSLEKYSLIVCHAVLEWLAEPVQAVQHIVDNMTSGSYLSLSFFNQDAALFSNLIYGNFDYLDRGMKVKNQVRLNPQQPLSPQPLIADVEHMDVKILKVSGIRCFHDYLRDKREQSRAFPALLKYEKAYFQTEPFCWLGKYIHLLIQKN